MTVSVLALVTDMMRYGKLVVGFGFNSNGRYAPSGLLRDRFIFQLRAAEPFGGFADGIPVEDSYVKLPEIPGVGFQAKKLFHVMKTLMDS